MKAIIFRNRVPKIENTRTSNLSKHSNVLLKVEYCGLCGSDMNKINDKSYVLENKILGHEISATVLDPLKSELKKGDRVVVNPLIPCNQCVNCKKGSYGLCPKLNIIGRDIYGGFAETLEAPIDNVFKLSDWIPLQRATFIDLIACGIHSYNLSKKPKNKKVLIIGDGPLGLLTSIILKEKNNTVSILGKHYSNLSLAKNIGISNATNNPNNIKTNYYDIVIECVGRNQSDSINLAISSAKKRATIIVSGVFTPKFHANINVRELYYKEIKMRGSNCHGVYDGINEFTEAIKFAETNNDIDKLITHTLDLKDFEKGIELMNNKDKGVIKVIFKNEIDNI